jgi:hypothetical protein
VIICDATVVRSFAVLGWHEVLAELCGGRFACVPDVASLIDGQLEGELAVIRYAIERDALSAQAGSSSHSALIAGRDGLDQLVAAFDSHVEVVELATGDALLALNLSDPGQREWRHSRGVPATALGIGEAASIAAALSRQATLATDDRQARVVFERLGGTQLRWTTDLLADAVRAHLRTAAEARAALDDLRRRFHFHAPDVSFGDPDPSSGGGSR